MDSDSFTSPINIVVEKTPTLGQCLSTFLTLRSAVACQLACPRWYQLSQEGNWVKRCVLHGGVAVEERVGLWKNLANVKNLETHWCERLSKEECSKEKLDAVQGFEVLASRELPKGKASEIERDVNRTFPTHPKFKGEEGSSSRKELSRLLCAIVAAEPDVGYCQGMNFVAATLLIHLQHTYQAFWMLLAMLECCHFRYVFAPGVPLLPLRIFQFSGVVREHLPRLWRHLKQESFSLDIFAHQCVLTLFAYSIEPDFLVHIYDVFFLLGWKAVFRVGLGLLADIEQKLLSMSIEDISRFLHQCKRHVDPSADANGASGVQHLLSKLLQYEVTDSTLTTLQHDFQLERWAALIERSDGGQGTAGEEPLPMGLARSASGNSFLWQAQALSSDNSPAWLSDRSEIKSTPPMTGMLTIPLEALQTLKAKLHEFDTETYRDINSLQKRVIDAEKQLAELLRYTEDMREEIEALTAERNEFVQYKETLVETLRVAVETSAASQEKEGRNERDADELVRQCMDKLTRLESDMHEHGLTWKERYDEWEPINEQIEELKDFKKRSMNQLSDFIDGRAHERMCTLDVTLRDILDAECVASH